MENFKFDDKKLAELEIDAHLEDLLFSEDVCYGKVI